MNKIELNELNLDLLFTPVEKKSYKWKLYRGNFCYYKELIVEDDQIANKIDLISNTNTEYGLCQPLTIVYDNNKFKGYIVEEVMNGIDYFKLSNKDYNLKEYIEIFKNIYSKVKFYETNYGFVFPDIGTTGNVLYNASIKENTIIDLDGIQLPNQAYSTVSSKIDNSVWCDEEYKNFHIVKDSKNKVDLSLIYNKKFYDSKNKSFKPVVNDLSILAMFTSTVLGFNFMREELIDIENFNTRVENILLKSGMDDSNLFYKIILNTINKNETNDINFFDAMFDLENKYDIIRVPSVISCKKLRKFKEKKNGK